MDIREASNVDLYTRMDVLMAYQIQQETYGWVPQSVEDAVFDGDPDPELDWNNWQAIEREIIRRVRSGEYA